MPEQASQDERLRRLLDDFSVAGLRFRLVLMDGVSEVVLHDGLGTVSADTQEDVWSVAEDLTIRATVAETSDAAEIKLRKLLASLVPDALRMERELLFFSRELAGRYGEVDLLTSVGETLGSGIVLERGVVKLLAELVGVMDASAAELWTADGDESHLARVAASHPSAEAATIDLKLSGSPLAEVFRGQVAKSSAAENQAELLVPVGRSPNHGLAGSMGVLRVVRPQDRMFRQSDMRLVTAIASQIGAAFENRRLIGESVERERMLVELELAHHLQLKLLPQVTDFTDCADIAARCEPAESVGGDFYHLFRLGEGRLGVMLGDVSSHGYSAGLIMALTMSAASLVVRESDRPGDVLRGIHHELVRKLESTDMYMTLCYVVLDPTRNRLRYANAGHPHAFRIGPAVADRLDALNPPLGIAEFDAYEERELSWYPGKDTLLLFTDGLSETIRADRLWSDDIIIEAVRNHLNADAGVLLEELFTIASPGDAQLADDRTALVLK
ncbi:MAG: PP2C family protein-serine/threonine phosphatase [Gemmatimonadota bacterium]